MYKSAIRCLGTNAYKHVARPLIFELTKDDPEKAHDAALRLLMFTERHRMLGALVSHFSEVQDPRLEQEIFGMKFKNPVGLAAGFDKHLVALKSLERLGFGFIDGGSITRDSQNGKSRPRIYRIPKDKALLNYMDFPNPGADGAVKNLEKFGRPCVPLGLSIWKSSKTPIEGAGEDCASTLGKLYPYGDFFIIDPGCPNDESFDALNAEGYLGLLLLRVMEEAKFLARKYSGPRKSILVKPSPDMTWKALDRLLQISLDSGVDGFEAVNTTKSREGLSIYTNKPGGLSGKPLFPRALEVVRHISEYTEGKVPVFGVGGIFSAQDAWDMIHAGAWAVKMQTGLYYEGQFAPANINAGLITLMRKNRIEHIGELRRR